MITMQQWMDVVNYRITEGSDYQWDCYGPNAYTLDSWNGDIDGHSFAIVFDTKTQDVYEVQAHDYVNGRAYRMVNPEFSKKMKKESKRRGVNKDEAWEFVNYVDLDVDADYLEKARAIFAGESYDTRVQIEVNFSDDELLTYMKLAHLKNITFNEFVEEALSSLVQDVKSGKVTKADAQRFVEERHNEN